MQDRALKTWVGVRARRVCCQSFSTPSFICPVQSKTTLSVCAHAFFSFSVHEFDMQIWTVWLPMAKRRQLRRRRSDRS